MDEQEIRDKVHDLFDRYTESWSGSLTEIEDAIVELIFSVGNEKEHKEISNG
jgi:hypothetical protein